MTGLWICLIILLVQQAIEDALHSKCVRVLNMAQFYMQGSCTEFWISLNMVQHAHVMPEYAWTWLNVHIQGNMPENVSSLKRHCSTGIFQWILQILNQKAPFSQNIFRQMLQMVLNMPHHPRYFTWFWICLRH